jgi:hypothetical protein
MVILSPWEKTLHLKYEKKKKIEYGKVNKINDRSNKINSSRIDCC